MRRPFFPVRGFVFLLIVVLYGVGFIHFTNWKYFPSRGDDTGYYLHAVSFWINQDVGDYGQTTGDLVDTYPQAAPLLNDPYLIRPTPKGRKYIKYPIGVALMETPALLLAHAYASFSETYPAKGWEPPYLILVSLSNVFFVLGGLWILWGLLRRHFSQLATTWTLLGIALGTNLFYQTTYVTMAHGFLFFDFCLLLWVTIRFYRRPGSREAFFLGLIVGLISITRVPELVSVAIPLLWGIGSRAALWARIRFFRRHSRYLLFALSGGLLIAALQMGYWHYVSGQLIFNPYQGEGFHFLRPEIWLGWFDFKNGWLIYTPIMSFALVGIIFLRRYFPDILLPLIVFLGLHVWIHYSYYVWTYFPGLGQRPMVETYPLLAFAMASFFQFLENKKRIFRWIPVGLVILCSALNLFQTWQMGQGLLISERGNGAYYFETLGATRGSRDMLITLDTGEWQPDSSKLVFQQTLVRTGFEDSITYPAAAPVHREGERAAFLLSGQDQMMLAPTQDLGGVPPGAWLRASLWAYMAPEHKIWARDQCANLVLDIRNAAGEYVKFKAIKVSSYIDNAGFSIWDTGGTGQWGEAHFYVRLPRKANKDWTVQAYITNPGGQPLYLDDFRLEAFVMRK